MKLLQKNKLAIFTIALIIIFMAIEVWGNLSKAQDNNQKINEAIDDAILNHVDDPDAHIEADQSVQNHKGAVVIDHPAGSVVNDKVPPGELNQSKLSDTELQIYTAFESLDGWDGVGAGISNSLLSVALQTSNVINTQRAIYSNPIGIGTPNPYNKNTFFQTAVKLNSSSDVLAYFMTGDFQDDDTDSNFGFKIEDGVLYALVVKAVGPTRTEFTTVISGITITNLNIYKAYFDVGEGKIYFYVNGVLEHTEETNLPTEETDTLFWYSVENKIGSNRLLAAAYLLYSREI